MAEDFSAREKLWIQRVGEWVFRGRNANDFPNRKQSYLRRITEGPNKGRKERVYFDVVNDIWNQWQNFTEHGQRIGKPKPHETWMTRRKAYMTRRYSGTPEGGFSGALGSGTTRKKKLLGA